MRATTHPTSQGHVTIPATMRHRGASIDDAIKDDIEAWRRSGASDTFECEGHAIEAFAHEYGITFRQAEKVWANIKTH